MSQHEGEGEEETTIELRDFQFNVKKAPCPTILLVGKRFSGKSYTSVSIANQFKGYDRWAAFCGTKDTEDFWSEKFESPASVRGPDNAGKEYLADQIKYQQRKMRLYKMLKQPFPAKYYLGLIFDDITAKREFRKGEILEDLFSNGRHYKTVIIISCQYVKQLPPAVRLNADYMILMHNAKRTCKILYEEYVEEPETFDMFLQLLRSVTGQTDSQGNDLFNGLVYNNVDKTSRIDDIFMIYRNEPAEEIDAMRIGKKEWREYNKIHYRDREQEEHDRDQRKQKRMIRLQEYRARQMERQGADMGQNPDLDYFSDSDSETNERHDSFQLVGKKNKGPRTTVKMSRKNPKVEASQYRSDDPYDSYEYKSEYQPISYGVPYGQTSAYRPTASPQVMTWQQQQQVLQNNRTYTPALW